MALSNKRRVFVEEYLRCWNATEAARSAGYKHPNVQGPTLLVNLSIKEAVEKAIAERAMSADEVLDRLAQQARGDLADFLTLVPGTSGKFIIDLEKAKVAGLTHLIKKLRYTEHGVEVELYDAQGALALLGKALGLFVERRVLESPGGKPLLPDLSKLPPDLLRALTDALERKDDGSTAD